PLHCRSLSIDIRPHPTPRTPFAACLSCHNPPTSQIYTLSLHDALPIWRVKSLSNILSGGNDHHVLIVRHILQCCQLFTLILLLLTTNKQKDIFHLIRQTTSKQYSVFLPLRQQNRCTPLLYQLQSV